MHRPSLFKSFYQGGFESSSHRRGDGRRLDLLAATGHDRFAGQDYAALGAHGLYTVRDGLRWHLIERAPGRYDWSSVHPMLEAAERQGSQVIWDLCHYGWPDNLDIWRPCFVERFARFAAAFAALLNERGIQTPFYTPINEMSFWAWAGGEVAYFNPMARGRGQELKHQLVRASIAAIEAIRAVQPQARFVLVDPLIHVTCVLQRAAAQQAAEHHRLLQFEAWDLLCGRLWPGLGGKPEYLDILGVNYYGDNQWIHEGPVIWRGEPHYRPFHGMLSEVYQRYKRPILIAETGAEGEDRVPWLRYVGEQSLLALQRGIPLEGMVLYPVLDYPGWTDDRYCPAGLLGYPDPQGQRALYTPLALELRQQQRALEQALRFVGHGVPSTP
ncbi:MAG: beta-glucosidase [Pseudomonadota bacterium]